MGAPPPPPPTEGAREAARESVAQRNERRAFQVAALLALGYTQRDVARAMNLHRNTVAAYASKTKQKETAR